MMSAAVVVIYGFGGVYAPAQAEESLNAYETAGEILSENTAEISAEATEEFNADVDCVNEALEGQDLETENALAADCVSHSDAANEDTYIDMDEGTDSAVSE